MNNKYKKGALIITIVLLVIVLPLTITGIIFNVKNNNIENPNKEFYYDNKLYFYSNTGDLVGKYDCMYKNCNYAKLSNADDSYGINYYKSSIDTVSLIDNQYAFIADYKDTQNSVILYDVKNNSLYASFKSVKNYGIGIDNNYYIVESLTGTYGVIKISNSKVENVIPFTYEYIALQDDIDLEQNKIATDGFIVKKENKWYLIDQNEAEFTAKMDYPIVAFDASTMIVKNETYNLYTYEGNLKLNGNYKYLNFISNCIEVRDVNDNYYILNSNLNLISSLYKVVDESIIETKINDDGKIEIIIDNESKEILENL